MQTIKESEAAIDIAINVLKSGGLIIFPCETVYGIACDSLNTEGVKRLIEYKERPFGKPFAIMCSSQQMAQQYVELNKTAKNLYIKYLPGPITVVSSGKHKVAMGIESETGTLGIRIPNYPFMLKLIEAFGHPIVATSANASYKKRPYKITDVLNHISDKQKSYIDLIIDAGTLPENEPSTVIDTTLDDPIVLRQGKIKLKVKNEILSRSEENTKNFGKDLWQKYEIHKAKRAIVFALEGEMGSGKTTFTKGLARAMGIKETITSPTFALENDYPIPKTKSTFLHFDAWRMGGSDELTALDFPEAIKKRSVISIEWAERVSDEIRKYDEEAIIIWVKILYGKENNERIISWGVV